MLGLDRTFARCQFSSRLARVSVTDRSVAHRLPAYMYLPVHTQVDSGSLSDVVPGVSICSRSCGPVWVSLQVLMSGSLFELNRTEFKSPMSTGSADIYVYLYVGEEVD